MKTWFHILGKCWITQYFVMVLAFPRDRQTCVVIQKVLKCTKRQNLVSSYTHLTHTLHNPTGYRKALNPGYYSNATGWTFHPLCFISMTFWAKMDYVWRRVQTQVEHRVQLTALMLQQKQNPVLQPVVKQPYTVFFIFPCKHKNLVTKL